MSTKKLKINKKSLKNAKTLPYIYSRFGLDFGKNLGKKMLYNYLYTYITPHQE